MTTPTHNPAFLDAEERARRFAGREHDLAELLRAVRENAARGHNQHALVLGPSGMGKTTLLLRAVDRVREEAALASVWFPLVAPEELYQAGSLGEVWLELVHQLARATGEARHERAYAALKAERDDARLAAAALAHLLDFADGRKRRLLLVLENLHLLFGEQLDERDAWAFREVLLHERRLMVLASATAAFSGLRRPDAALYELFLLHPLEPLDPRGCEALWRTATGAGLPPRRLRALELLTGGNPRLLTLLADPGRRHPLTEPAPDLMDLLDGHTDYLKLTTEALPALERKVFVSLARLWEEASAARVAEEARLDPNVASAQLARLEGRGLVLSRRHGRGKRYRPAEELYSLYHLLRGQGAAAERARAAVAFLGFRDEPSSGSGEGLAGFLALARRAEDPAALVRPALRLAAAGAGQAVLEALTASSWAPRLEPLLVALRNYLHQDAQAPPLIAAIAGDLLRDLEREKASAGDAGDGKDGIHG